MAPYRRAIPPLRQCPVPWETPNGNTMERNLATTLKKPMPEVEMKYQKHTLQTRLSEHRQGSIYHT
ncbi:hypothetical protein QC764_0098010 [Podospora pseudoanserina]|uniref:Uncharacterized protein n=1 Tax=Podospora pseudoanserina TaxID=2609844 RepID=A0ABR0HV27_9PEZI|nr:hypothetical protein QC764_0098010 [Podospora pseudoanserina]